MNDQTILATLSDKDFERVALGVEQGTDCQLYKNGMRPTLSNILNQTFELPDEATIKDAHGHAAIMD